MISIRISFGAVKNDGLVEEFTDNIAAPFPSIDITLGSPAIARHPSDDPPINSASLSEQT